MKFIRKSFQDTMKASIIIFFYYNPSNPELSLAGFERQSEKDFENLVADDGSRDEATEWVGKTIKNSLSNIRDVWHEDKRGRKTVSLTRRSEKLKKKICRDAIYQFIGTICTP